jgi:hypothetical protein
MNNLKFTLDLRCAKSAMSPDSAVKEVTTMSHLKLGRVWCEKGLFRNQKSIRIASLYGLCY